MKLSHRWHAIGITIDTGQRTIPLSEEIIRLLKGCEAGANHMTFSMEKGFERIFRQQQRNSVVSTQRPVPTQQLQWTGVDNTHLQYMDGM